MQPNRRHRVATLVAVGLLGVILLAALAGCGAGGADTPAAGVPGHGDGDALFPKLPRVTGHIDLVEAQAENPRYFSRLLLTDDAGQTWEFGSEDWVGVSVGHLKDHQIQGTPVTVWYETGQDGSLLARFVGD